MQIKSKVKDGASTDNHNRKVTRRLKVKSGIKAGGQPVKEWIDAA